MKLGIVVYSEDAETVWNAFRLGVFASKQGDKVSVFLLAKGVECESLDTDKYDVTGQMRALNEAGGEILACGTCLKIREMDGTELCPVSTMADLYQLVAGADKVVTF